MRKGFKVGQPVPRVCHVCGEACRLADKANRYTWDAKGFVHLTCLPADHPYRRDPAVGNANRA